MKALKHIGRISNTGAKVLVVFRTLPGESNFGLVLPVSQLSDSYHDALMQLVESDQAQETFEFGEIMHSRHFPDGRPMLIAMTQDGRLQKVPTDSVIMSPTPNANVVLSELNALIAEQKGVAVDDLAYLVQGSVRRAEKPNDSVESQPVQTSMAVEEDVTAVESESVLSDKDLAKSYRSQADAMYKEAARLRREADELDPPQKKATTKAKVEESA